ncbi:MAG TPA: BON domain-containing protein [Gemmatimonadaceae bacterium]|nr:BON domain-containing protein [Gemmatimonadaceae bacterium]
MSTSTTDQELQREVLDALSHDTSLLRGEIAVSVRDGVVTLSGIVRTYAEKCEALDAALRCSGVNAVADEVRVRVPAGFGPSDSDMAAALMRSLADELGIPTGDVHITVQNGWVTLTGRVARREQCDAIDHAARTLIGFTGLSNLVQTAARVADVAQAQIAQPASNGAAVYPPTT